MPADGQYYSFPGDKRQFIRVTAFLDIVNKPFLNGWYAKMERELIKQLASQGKTLDEILEYLEPKQPYGAQHYMEETSAWGNKIHRAIDYTLKDLKLPKLTKAERKVYDKWLEWWKAQEYTLESAEETVRSERHGFAGTLDARVLTLADKHRKILDWKTGKNHYDSHTWQNIAYQIALAEYGIHSAGGELVYIPREKEIWTVPVESLAESELQALVLAALSLWRKVNKKPWGENA